MFRGMVRVLLFVLIVCQFCVENAQLQKTAQCGVSQINKTKLIVHGHGTVPGEWPWHTAVYHRKRFSDVYACGGTLLSEQFVLTAAHCVIADNGYQVSSRNIFVRMGVHDLYELIRNAVQQHSIRKIYKHLDYSSEDVQNDIAILELATEVEFNSYVQPVCLGLTEDLTGQLGTVIGWGRTENEDVSPILRSARMPVVDFLTCLKSDRAVFGETLSEGILCAGFTNGTTVCNGDSGSGLFFQQNGAWYLGGIVSYTGLRSLESRLCSTNGYGAFTNVRTYLPWITSITGRQLEDNDNVCEVRDAVAKGLYENLLPSDCGTPTPSEGSADNSVADLFEYPWMAIVNYDRTYYEFYDEANICEGTLISNRYVLTAAQCVDRSYETIQVSLGEYKLRQINDCAKVGGTTTCAPQVQQYDVECVLRHRNYDTQTKINDIALLRLAREVTFTDHIRPICLPVTRSLPQTNPIRFVMSSWSYRGDSLREISVEQVDDGSTCQNVFVGSEGVVQPWKGHRCARMLNNLDYCFSHSGAPLGISAAYGGMRFVQFGIVSFSGLCQTNGSILYTDVTDYMDWIVTNLKP